METNKITYALIEQYLQGKLDDKAMHELERQALDDPFLADAMEGYTHTDAASASHLSILQKQLQNRIELQYEKKNIFNFTWQRISIAAAASLLFVSASILFWMKGTRHEKQIAATEKKVDVTLMSKDSVPIHKSQTKAPKFVSESPLATKNNSKKIPSSTSKKIIVTKTKHAENLYAKTEITSQSQQLNEVVITGYPTQRKQNLTGSTSDVSNVALRAESLTLASKRADSNALNDVIVVGYGSKARFAKPVNGWNDYKKYLRNNIQNPETLVEDVHVTVSFLVDADGSPYRINILKGYNEAFNQEAIRLVQYGPKWNPGASEITIDFKK